MKHPSMKLILGLLSSFFLILSLSVSAAQVGQGNKPTSSAADGAGRYLRSKMKDSTIAQADKFLNRVRNMESSMSPEKYSELLHNLLKRITLMKEKYKTKEKIHDLLNYLQAGILEMDSAASGTGDLDAFWKELNGSGLITKPDCPLYSLPPGNYCADGQLIPQADKNGCALPPVCKYREITDFGSICAEKSPSCGKKMACEEATLKIRGMIHEINIKDGFLLQGIRGPDATKVPVNVQVNVTDGINDALMTTLKSAFEKRLPVSVRGTVTGKDFPINGACFRGFVITATSSDVIVVQNQDICPAYPAVMPICKDTEYLQTGSIDPRGCPLPPVCKQKECPVYPAVMPICKDTEYLQSGGFDARGCRLPQVCKPKACMLQISAPNPDSCVGGAYVAQFDVNGCVTSYTCVISASGATSQSRQ